jgi:hypothetical protein
LRGQQPGGLDRYRPFAVAEIDIAVPDPATGRHSCPSLDVFRRHLSPVGDAERPFLMPLSAIFMIIVLAAWASTFAGLVDSRLNAIARAAPLD